MDNELKAMATVLKAISELSGAGRFRVLHWINQKVDELEASEKNTPCSPPNPFPNPVKDDPNNQGAVQ